MDRKENSSSAEQKTPTAEIAEARSLGFEISADGTLTEYTGTDSFVTIPRSVRVIGGSAFYDCKNLIGVYIPDTVTRIEESAFEWCIHLAEIRIPNSVTDIGDRAFAGCEELKKAYLPAGVRRLGDSVFAMCRQLREIEVDEANAAYRAKQGCLIETETKRVVAVCVGGMIPNDGSVAVIGENAFSYLALKKLCLHESVIGIEKGAFSRCKNLSEIRLSGGLRSIGDAAFFECGSIVRIVIPEGVTTIGNGAFSGCKRLREIYLPDSVRSVGQGAFRFCTALKGVSLPAHCRVGEWAFPADCEVTRRK